MDEEFAVFSVIALIAGLLLAIMAGLGYEQCRASAKQNGVEYQWGVLAGCSYKHPPTGLWVPKENYRAVGD